MSLQMVDGELIRHLDHCQPMEPLNRDDVQAIRHQEACNDGSCNQDHVHENSAKDKLNSAGQAIKDTARNIGDKAVELKDKAKEKVQDGVDIVRGI